MILPPLPDNASRELIRHAVLIRDEFRCRRCGIAGKMGLKAEDISVHHILAAKAGGEMTLDNLETLCWRCHRAADRAYWLSRVHERQRRDGLNIRVWE